MYNIFPLQYEYLVMTESEISLKLVAPLSE